MERSLLDVSQVMYWVMPSMLAVRFRCVSITPLGSPVVPDVNMISARSSGSMATCSGSGSPYISLSSSSKVISGRPRSVSSLGVYREVNASLGVTLETTRST